MSSNSRPYVVEFSGTPEAGKTTAIQNVASLLHDTGYSVKVIRESAEDLPEIFPKASFDSQLWMLGTTLRELALARNMKNVDIVLVDRGMLDLMFWNEIAFLLSNCTAQQKNCKKFFLKSLDLMPDYFIAFSSSPEESIKRRGGEGRLVTANFISRYNYFFTQFYQALEVPKLWINTNDLSREEIAGILFGKILVEFS